MDQNEFNNFKTENFLFWGAETIIELPSAPPWVEGSVRLLLTKTPPVPSVDPYLYLVWNGSRGPDRQLTRYGAPSKVLTALWGARSTQHVVDLGSVLIGRRVTRCSLSPSPRLRWPEIVATPRVTSLECESLTNKSIFALKMFKSKSHQSKTLPNFLPKNHNSSKKYIH